MVCQLVGPVSQGAMGMAAACQPGGQEAQESMDQGQRARGLGLRGDVNMIRVLDMSF